MHRLDNELKAALTRKEAPAGFARRAIERVEREAPYRSGRPRRPVAQWKWALAAAATLILAVGAGVYEHHSRARHKSEAALEKVVTALSITATQLDRAEKKAFSNLPLERLREQLAGASGGIRPESLTDSHSSDERSRI
jgi:hypothetical protein